MGELFLDGRAGGVVIANRKEDESGRATVKKRRRNLGLVLVPEEDARLRA